MTSSKLRFSKLTIPTLALLALAAGGCQVALDFDFQERDAGPSACSDGGLDCSSFADQCNVGMCDPASGSCQAVAVDDGTTCDDGSDCTATDVCTAGVCAGTTRCACSVGLFLGYATWTQIAVSQTDTQQDAAMDTACATAFTGSRAATTDEIVEGLVGDLPTSNTSGIPVIGKCPNCAGIDHPGCVELHARNCVRPDDTWPTVAEPWPNDRSCSGGMAAAVCLINDPPCNTN